jgi:hypothetical protein
MLEAALALGCVAILSAGVWAWSALGPEVLLATGLWLVAGGLGFGLPTGIVYHVELHRALAKLGLLPRRWWLRPISLHPLLPPEDVFRVLAWCRLGAFGCAVAFVGCGVFGLGAFRLLLATR